MQYAMENELDTYQEILSFALLLNNQATCFQVAQELWIRKEENNSGK